MKVMMNVRWTKVPTLNDICKRFGLSSSDVDQNFGVVLVTPEDNTCTFMVEQSKTSKVKANDDDDWFVEGPFSNVPVEVLEEEEEEEKQKEKVSA